MLRATAARAFPDPQSNGPPPAAMSHPSRVIPCGPRRLIFTGRPLLMGIVNMTPDSFSDGGAFTSPRHAVAHALRLVEHGADLIDVGGESTRPGARPVSVTQELRRVLPVIEGLAGKISVPIAIDTAKPEVADKAVRAGASIINDVTALADPAMPDVAARAKAAVVLMHMRGTPRTMQRRPRYNDVVREVRDMLMAAARRAQRAGIRRERILIDPGLGFGKTLSHNLTLMRHLKSFVRTGYPVVVGYSRKSFLGRLLKADVSGRLPGDLACLAQAWEQGVQIVRIHDVQAAAAFLRVRAAFQ